MCIMAYIHLDLYVRVATANLFIVLMLNIKNKIWNKITYKNKYSRRYVDSGWVYTHTHTHTHTHTDI